MTNKSQVIIWKPFPPENPVEDRQILVRSKDGTAENLGYDVIHYWGSMPKDKCWFNGDVFYGNDSFEEYCDLL